MSRYRPPQPKGSCYITPEGKTVLAKELDFLWHTRRPEVVKALSAAAAEGDRSENAEYIYRKKELGSIDWRVRFLSKRLEELRVVGQIPDDVSKIFFGAWVELEDKDGNTLRYRIVGPDEFDMQKEYISMDSPVAKALMKKSAGDEVVIKSPKGKLVYEILDVRYSTFD